MDILLAPDFVSTFSFIARFVLVSVLFVPLMAIIIELRTQDDLSPFRWLIIGFISSFMLSKLSLGIFQFSKILSEIPVWLSSLATLVTSSSDLAMALCVVLMVIYFRRRLKRIRSGMAYNRFMNNSTLLNAFIVFSVVVIIFFLGIIAVFSFATFRNVTEQGLTLNEMYSVIKDQEGFTLQEAK